jgi:hypothetical protein
MNTSEKLLFSAEVLDSKVGLPQVRIKRTKIITEYIVKIYNPDTFKILIHTEGVTPTSSNKFFKLILNGGLNQSSKFSPKEVLEINCEILKGIGRKNFSHTNIHEFSVFQIKIYNSQETNENEIYTLSFRFYPESIYWTTKLLGSKNSFLIKFARLFNSAISFFSQTKFTISGDIPIKLSSFCDFEKFSFKITDDLVHLRYSEISMIFLMRTSMIINMKNSTSYTFDFEGKCFQDIDHLLNFISFIYGTEIIGLSSCPKLYMDIDLVDSTLIPCQKELCIQQKNYLAYFTSIGKKKVFKIVIDLHKIEISQFGQSMTLKVLINGKNFSTHSISTVGRIDIDLVYKEGPIYFNPYDKIELKFYLTDKPNIFQNELFFRHKIFLIKGVLPEYEIDDHEDKNFPKTHQNQVDLNLLEFPQIPELNSTEIIPEQSEMQSFPEIPNEELYEDSLEKSEIPEIPNEDSNKPSGVSSWSVDRVCQWIRRLGSVYEDKKYDSIFRENGIDGNALLNIEKNDLKEMGIKLMGDRINMISEINKLK